MKEPETIKLNWQKPTTDMPHIGQYFVAVNYPAGFGTFDFAEWDGKQWKLGYEADVVGWVTMTDFMKDLKADWPKWDSNK